VRRHFLVKGLAFLVLASAVLAALAFIVMSLWNALVPSLFAGPVVSFWQAAGLLVLSRILFGGFRGRGGRGWRHRGWHGRWGRMSPEERSRVREGFLRWKDMSREERREFRGTLHGRFHGCGTRIPDELAEPKETSSGV
jgi:hypothetical protein